MNLTAPERSVLDLVRAGRPDAEIAVRLGLSTEEVKRRVAVICTKLGVESRVALRVGAPSAHEAAVDGFEPNFAPPMIDFARPPAPEAIIDFTATAIPALPASAEANLEAARRALAEYANVTEHRGSPLPAITGVLAAAGIAAGVLWMFINR